MGADLTIIKTGRYFRDSYNTSNSWWPRKMSYWDVQNEIQKRHLVTKDGNLSKKGVAFICSELESHPFPSMKKFKEDLNLIIREEMAASVERDDVVMEKLYELAKKKDAEMVSFWDEAKEAASDVSWSV